MMRFGFLAIFVFFFCIYSEAQNLSSKSDSVVTAYYYTDLLPPEFTSPALENEYYSDSNSVAIQVHDFDYVFVLKLRNNCTFIYEIYYRPYNRARVWFAIGNYTISGNKIHLTYKSLLSRQPGKIYLEPTISVSWSLPDSPKYLLIKKAMLSESNKKRPKKKIFYTLKDKPQFDLGGCN